jgi:SET domain-containing protein
MAKAGKKSTGKKKAARAKRVDGIPVDLVYVDKSPIHGKGMFARKRIKKNVTLGPLLGKLTRKDGTYVLWLSETEGFRVTNDFRFINHDSNPNCALTDVDVVTLRAIEPGEELTHDYGW